MAILNSLIVSGASRFLNTAYFQDVSVSGTATLSSLSLSGNLSVTGTSTLSGHVSVGGYNNTSYGLSANSAIINNWIRTVGSTGWYNESHGGGWWMKDNDYIRSYNKPVLMDHNMYFGTAGDSGYYVKTTGAAKFASVAAPTGNISTINSDNVSVSNNLHATHFDLQTVAQLGGSFYVSPTVKFPNSGTKLAVSKSSTQLTLTIKDSSISTNTMAGIVWTANSAVKVSGTINGVVTGTMDGTIDSITNGSQMVVKVSGGNWNSVSATSTDLTSSQFSDLTVMVYQRRQDGNDYRVGIWMNCYDLVNSSSTIRVYGGTSSTPNVTIGNLTGSTFNGETISGNNNWGILTTMGYFEGAIVSTEGQIGGWTIGDTKLYHNTDSITSTYAGLYLGTDGIRNYASGTQYVNITSGKITALGVDVSGKITANSGTIGGVTANSSYGLYTNSKTSTTSTNTGFLISKDGAIYLGAYNSTNGACPFQVTSAGALTATSGKIGGWNIGTSSLYSGTHSAYNSNVDGIFMDSTYLAGGKQAMWYLKNDGSAKIGALTLSSAGVLAVPAANITGTLSADHIDTSSITIGQSQVDGLSTALGNKANSSTVTALSNKVTAVYGTCDTAANTQVKNVTCSNFEYYDGALITVAFSTANTYNVSTIRLNVNSKGQKNIKVANVITAADNCLLWGAGAVITFRYDGDYFVVVGEPRTWYGASTTAANTYVKTDTTAVTGCVICKGTVVSLSMQHDNTATTPFLNIAGTGNIELYAGNGTTRPLTSNGLGWTAGSTAQFIFDGQYWRVGDTAGLARAYSAQSTANTANTNATNAAKTATNFITADGTNGIKIHKTSNTTDYSQITTDYVQIISDGTHIYKGGNDVAVFGDTVRLGRIADGVMRTQIDSDSFDVIKRASNTDTVLATFGETAVIGNMSARGVSIDSNGFKFNNSGEQNFFIGIDNRQAETITSGNATVTNSSTNQPIDGLTYYRVAQIPSGATVVSVVGTFESAVENGEPVVFAAEESNVSHWTVSSGYLWVEDGYSSYSQFEETIKYSYTTQANSNLPYMVFGTSAYENDIIAGVNSFAQGYKNKALGSFSTALGSSAVASGTSSFACGVSTKASGEASFACGVSTKASGRMSFACGKGTVASGVISHAEGVDTTASGAQSHAEGASTTASSISSHAEGINTTASGNYSHAEGYNTTASNTSSHSEGFITTASGEYSHTEGCYTIASGMGSHAGGGHTVATWRYNTVIGMYNKATVSGTSPNYTYSDTGDYPFIIGNGTADTTARRSNAFTVDWSGNVWAAGKVMAANTSHVGMIIMSTTLDTMAKVISIYGGTTWIQHSGYFLYGASSGVTANHAAADGGEANHTLTINEMPSHSHRVFSYYTWTSGQWDGLVYQSMYNEYRDHANGGANFIENTGGGAAHNNMPPYKQVYIWERTA